MAVPNGPQGTQAKRPGYPGYSGTTGAVLPATAAPLMLAEQDDRLLLKHPFYQVIDIGKMVIEKFPAAGHRDL